MELYEPGNILFVKDFRFEDNTTHDKLVIILLLSEDRKSFVYSLTTSQEKVPLDKMNHGCTNSNDENLSFYMFLENRAIGLKNTDPRENFSFDKNTFLLFQGNVNIVSNANFDFYSKRNNVSLLGSLSPDELKRIRKCIKASRLVTRRIKAMFE